MQQVGQQIRQQLTLWCQAVATKDLAQILAIYAPDVRAFDAVAALQFRGLEAYRAHWQLCLSLCGPSHFELAQLEISSSSELAFSHALTLCGGSNAEGEMQSSWLRCTQCWRLLDGQWRVVHEHFSVPFDSSTGETLFSLQPE